MQKISVNRMKRFVNGIREYILSQKYNIGFINGDIHSVMNGESIKVNWLLHSYKDRWFADPFILDISENNISVLVEEWYDPIQRGRISKLTIDKGTFVLKDIKVLLEAETHLSFPMIMRKNDGIYVYPENSAIGKWVEYKYNQEKDNLEEQRTMADIPLTDSVFCDYFNEPLMFSTCLPDANGKRLGIYSWSKDKNQYVSLKSIITSRRTCLEWQVISFNIMVKFTDLLKFVSNPMVMRYPYKK